MINNRLAWLILAALVLTSCTTPPARIIPRKGDEIVAAGQFIHTGTPVVLWMDPGGFDAYRVERRFSPIDKSDWAASQADVKDLHTPNRYDLRSGLSAEQAERVRGGGWDLPSLQQTVDQFVIHYDVAGTSRNCFKTLHDKVDLSVHFLLDLDGTIYQTLDLKERARHATTSNSRSIGIEIANLGAYAEAEKDPFAEWYQKDSSGHAVIHIPQRFGPNSQRALDFSGRPVRRELVVGAIHNQSLRQYDFTPEQYAALVKLTAALCTVFPKITCDYPRNPDGSLLTRPLLGPDLDNYHGVLGHYHIQANKVDPGPAFQWDYVIGNARCLMQKPAAKPVKLLRDN